MQYLRAQNVVWDRYFPDIRILYQLYVVVCIAASWADVYPLNASLDILSSVSLIRFVPFSSPLT
jgi:hypothetical protein